MASALAEANIVAKQRLQHVVAAAVAAAWDRLQHYNREQLSQWLNAVLPMTAAANQQTVMLTRAFIAQALGEPSQGIDPQPIVAGIRNGVTPAEVYTRPFVTVWGALGRGVPWAQAVQMGRERAVAAASTDVQLSFTHTIASAGSLGDRIVGWNRVPDATACDFCNAAADLVYSTGDLLPLHTYCSCGVEPIFSGSRRPAPPTRFEAGGGVTVAVRQHGELGPVLVNAADHFTTQSEIDHSH